MLTQGSSDLVRQLLPTDLVDELLLTRYVREGGVRTGSFEHR